MFQDKLSEFNHYRSKFNKIVIPDVINIFLVRKSRIAPAISGAWQAENDHLPCRMFKNISYGHLTNIMKAFI